MRAASVAFPFKRTFTHMELERSWWHRLSIVIFFATLLGTSVFLAGVSYIEFAPKVSTMPDVKHDPWEVVSVEPQSGIDLSAGFEPKRSGENPAVQFDPYASYGGHIDLKQSTGSFAVQAMMDSHGTVHQVSVDKVTEALQAGEKRVVRMYDPQEIRRWVPEDELLNAVKAGGKLAPSTNPDTNNYKQLDKTIEMPDGSLASFAGSVSDDTIRARWNHAKNLYTLRAVLLTFLVALSSTVVVSYLMQLGYRAFLYVLFGGAITSSSK